ncbi:nucleotidyl transferase AbiEii/AbiGii toxin family protein [Leisingera caerulea]|uniref:nucleotidyl transferase AbiEii/AbiGii toxin family protein n=1 Tax=Leisingera caerulea TaxID=506591 RepID=UPI002481144D|nr:nucleotidyl transferase AbiEii/AbiGii toxin family protein [Leisingera caerulea]
MDPRYKAQVQLLVNVLPAVASVDVFALKGGTAINLFHFDLPRLSVDIDLTYLPVQNRNESLRGISDGLGKIIEEVETLRQPGLSVSRILGGRCGEHKAFDFGRLFNS